MKPKSHIVVGVDGSPGADAALDWAADEAGLRVVFAYGNDYTTSAVAMYGRVPMPERAHVIAGAERVIDAALIRVAMLDPTVSVEGDAIDMDSVHALLTGSADAELVVLGSRELHALGSVIRGSVVQLLRRVLAARSSSFAGTGRRRPPMPRSSSGSTPRARVRRSSISPSSMPRAAR